MQRLANLIGVKAVDVVDVGANPIDGKPPYDAMRKSGLARVVGFEPQPDALARLNAARGPNETYLPYVVGAGDVARFRTCKAPGMSSTLAPNLELLKLFHGFAGWAEVLSEQDFQTHRLDDLAEIANIDFLKIDVQGGELAVFKGAEKKLAEAVVVQTEVNFLPMYENQPLFADLDQHLRGLGFSLHTLTPIHHRALAPVVIRKSIFEGLKQVFWTDAVYIKDFTRLSLLSSDKLRKLALILHAVYGSYDVAQHVLHEHDRLFKTKLWPRYMKDHLGLD